MKFYGVDMQGVFQIQSVSTLPAWGASDERRWVYAEDTKSCHYGTDEGWREFGSGGGGFESDMYQDLLLHSIYTNMTFDDFIDEDLINTGSSDMTYASSDNQYSFSAGQILQSENLADATAVIGLGYQITECLVSIDHSDSGTPTIEVSTDATNWESATNNTIHTFTEAGTELYIKFTSTGTGIVKSWAVLYYPDASALSPSPSRRKFVTFYYEGVAIDEDDIIEGFYFDNNITIDKVTIHARVAPTGANLTTDILIGGAEQSRTATLTAAATYERTTFGTALNVATTDRFGMTIKTVGSTEPGQGLIVIVHYYDRAG